MADGPPRALGPLLVRLPVTDTPGLLRQLPEEQREAFLLRFVDDWSYEDIATITGDSVSVLKMRAARGLDRLRRLLKERGDG
jgi:DNA-directed RNA polymerase specialized sigma24 family protein